MPISTNVAVRATAAMLLVGFLALAAIVGTTIWLVERNNIYFTETLEARIVRATTVNLRNFLQDAETGQRGFLLTNEARYREPYDAAVPQIAAALDAMDAALAEHPEMSIEAGKLRADVQEKLAELAETIVLVDAGRRDDALAIVRSDVGKQAMDAARLEFSTIIEDADDRILRGVEDQRAASIALRWVAIIGAFIILAVVGTAVWTVLTYTRELSAARREVETANLGLEDRVRERTSDLFKANEEIQRFAYIVTHDLRAPLVNIMGFTSELETGVASLRSYMDKRDDSDDLTFADAKLAATEDLPEAIGFIRSSTRKMDALINAILKISREGRRQLKPETIDLQSMVDASLAAIHHQIVDNGGTAIADIKVPRVTTDKLSLEQALGNLLDNAVKYREPTRPLTIEVRATLISGNRITIDVQDNGRGIAESDHERVFELFRRSGIQSQPGEGIGLAHVRTMVRSLGGDITVTSKLGSGTTFTITLPRDLRVHLGRTTP